VAVRSANGQELRGKWLQTGFRAPLTLRLVPAGTTATDGGTPDAAPAFASTFTSRAVTLTNPADQVKLAGTLTLPDGQGPFPAAVLLSDMGPHNRDGAQDGGDYRMFATLATSLSRQGIAVLRLDDRGVGQSGGRGSATTTEDRVRDAQAGLNYLRSQASIDPTRLGLIGHGEGGNVALLAAARPLAPGFVVALAAAGLPGIELLASQPEPMTPADTAKAGVARRAARAEVLRQAEKLRASGSNAAQVETYLAQQLLKQKAAERKEAAATYKFRRALFEIVKQNPSDEQAQAIVTNMLRQRYPAMDPGLVRARATESTSPWTRFYLRFDPQTELAKAQCPVLLLQGGEDREVAADPNLAVLEKGLKNNKSLAVRRLPGVNHQFKAPRAELLASADGEVSGPLLAPAAVENIRTWVLEQTAK
jgi:pimeloyl-ACP methyl ester carboxylesterase